MKHLFFLFLALLLTSCGEGKVPSGAKSELAEALREAKQALQEIAPDGRSLERLAKDEAEKLLSVEYQVFEIEDNGNINHINAVLNKIGKLRWDCFHLEKEMGKYKCFCKRRPKSYLRYITRRF